MPYLIYINIGLVLVLWCVLGALYNQIHINKLTRERLMLIEKRLTEEQHGQ